ncbi:putative DNA-directed RNA polymerase I subunit RPA2 [Porphyridium purpureum]|uniref:DNA-directed RNA polymerase subunit beta n=1 Tax=Porphyridium purpureum TaxID=35688 RepID=A0A5J4YXV2_PORPP|nr:putative DNA-directed RNA polymerase I subunit RPA2 [Porphyridium purpureum]|eukprot:POR5436..scf209_3
MAAAAAKVHWGTNGAGVVQASTLDPKDEAARVKMLRSFTRAHLDSFNFAVTTGLERVCEEMESMTIEYSGDIHSESKWSAVRLEKTRLIRPRAQDSGTGGTDAATYGHSKVLPNHCRESGKTYAAQLVGTFLISNSAGASLRVEKTIGVLPIMVSSSHCHLSGLSPRELLALGEEEYELGGYFIINGVEKVLRMLIASRKNHMIAIERDSNKKRGPQYSPYSVSMRCGRPDMSTRTIHLHYLVSGTATLRLTINRQEFLVPVVLVMRALLPDGTTDEDICRLIVGPMHGDMRLFTRVLSMIHDAQELELAGPRTFSSERAPKRWFLAYLGLRFRQVLRPPSFVSDETVGQLLLRRYVLVHLSTRPEDSDSQSLDSAKAQVLGLMIRRLCALVSGDVASDSSDSLMHQEILLPGHLFLMYLRDRLEVLLESWRNTLLRRASIANPKGAGLGTNSAARLQHGQDPHDVQFISSQFSAAGPVHVGKKLEYFIATGNLESVSGLDLMDKAGFAVVAERINFLRFISHFRAVHRGNFFTKSPITSVRRLLPEAWGFVCPVHTPDGAPCGLLNHLTSSAEIAQQPCASYDDIAQSIRRTNLAHEVLLDSGAFVRCTFGSDALAVVVDGRVFGYVPRADAKELATRLRLAKVGDVSGNMARIPPLSEIVCISGRRRLFQGVFIYTAPSRLMRPVEWLEHGRRLTEYIGTFEQMFLRVATNDTGGGPEEQEIQSEIAKFGQSAAPERASHRELNSMNTLSILASLTPFSDLNQSPRNMYQCQMSKQTMGTPCHNFSHRADTKMYRIQTPQVPLTRNFQMQDAAGMDLFPNGTNAVVAVISYTGNDMEDALIINKASYERGFCAGTVYTTIAVNLDENAPSPSVFGGNEGVGAIGKDGLPEVGAIVNKGDALYSVILNARHERFGNVKTQVTVHKSSETAIVDQVRILPPKAGMNPNADSSIRRVSIKLRYPRRPTIGDKFASRHGQKGTVAALWPEADMPFTDSGMIPDILFNPNGFPSRMTIGMMVESMCGKTSSTYGLFQDSTPFRFDDQMAAYHYFGEQLLSAGYNYYGNEVMYSGYTGEPLEVDIFIGVVHYQRLRHMVSDKFQVRSSGRTNPLTRQPIAGRKMGGAIRFGEMERDALLGHGTAQLVQDRLHHCSDLHTVYLCNACHSVLSVARDVQAIESGNKPYGSNVLAVRQMRCRSCGQGDVVVKRILLPYVYRYLANELAAMNIEPKIFLD